MSECVVRMEMPRDCWLCPNGHQDWIYKDEGSEQMVCFCNICDTEEDHRYITETEDNRPDWCPIICQLPEGHGRLVDADACASVLKKLENEAVRAAKKLCYGFSAAMFEEGNTIVPAERSET